MDRPRFRVGPRVLARGVLLVLGLTPALAALHPAAVWCGTSRTPVVLPAELPTEAGDSLSPVPGGSVFARWRQLLDDRPEARDGAAIAYDPSHRRFLTYGGLDNSTLNGEVWELDLDPRPHWFPVMVAGSTPPRRAYAVAAFDPDRQRLIIQGGLQDHGPSGDTWMLDLTGTPHWTDLDTVAAGGGPPARFKHSSIWDPRRSRMLVFGGSDGRLWYNDVWQLEFGAQIRWSQLGNQSSALLYVTQHSAAYDLAGDRMLLYGGIRTSEPSGSLLAFPFERNFWYRPEPTSVEPNHRWEQASTWDPFNQQMVIFGGASAVNGSMLNDTWIMTNPGTPRWNRVGYIGYTPGRVGATLVSDPNANQVLLFGGWDGHANYTDLRSLSLYSPVIWSPVTTIGTRPSARSFHCAVLDSARRRVLVFGGWDGRNILNDVYELRFDLSPTPSWQRLTPAGTPPVGRDAAAAVYDPVGDRMIVFGGNCPAGRLNDVWSLERGGDSNRWVQLVPKGTPPSPRWFHSAIYDSRRHRVVITGGADPDTPFGDTWALWLEPAPRWELLRTNDSSPRGREYASWTVIPDRDVAMLHGGSDQTGSLSDTWAFDLDSNAWTGGEPFSTSGPSLGGHLAGYDPTRRQLDLVGGFQDSKIMGDGWSLDLAGSGQWTSHGISGSFPTTRDVAGGGFDSTSGRLIVVGGNVVLPENGTQFLNDVGGVTPGGSWTGETLISSAAHPSGDGSYVAVYDELGDKFFLYDCDQQLLWTYRESDSPRWSLVPTTGTPPSTRYGARAVYDNRRQRMILFSGYLVNGGSGLRTNDVWQLSLSGVPQWTQLLPPSEVPPPRGWPAMVYDPQDDWVLIHGGVTSEFGVGLDDAWALELSPTLRWKPIGEGTPRPSGRGEHVGVWEWPHRRLVVAGGFDEDSYDRDIWSLSLADASGWQQAPYSPLGPSACCNSAAVYDEKGSQMLIVDGSNSNFPVGTVWKVDLRNQPQVSVLKTDGNLPARQAHVAVMDPNRRRVLVFGGTGLVDGGFMPLDDLWELSFEPPAPPASSTQALPAARSYEFAFRGVQPNPARGSAMLSFELPKSADVRIRIFDITGRAVAEETLGSMGPGAYRLPLPGVSRLHPGVYVVKLSQGGNGAARRLVMLK